MTIQGMTSVLIPARNEIFLYKTIKDLLEKATGEIEVIAVLDGYWMPPEEIIEDKRVIYLHYGTPRGMRNGINMAASIARGEFLTKSDAHNMYEKGFDEVMKKDMQDNWILIPRRMRLDAEKWCLQEDTLDKLPIDYEYLSSPAGNGAKGNIWNERTAARMDPKYNLDENLSFQGSCWMMKRDWYWHFLGGMSEVGYGNFVREAQEIGLKTWLGGGAVMTTKKTWYAHLHKGPKYGRMYYIDKFKMIAGNEYCDDFWFNNRWTEAIHDLAWLIERFAPVPTWTPELIEQVRKK
jgi:hypothetical protein